MISYKKEDWETTKQPAECMICGALTNWLYKGYVIHVSCVPEAQRLAAQK